MDRRDILEAIAEAEELSQQHYIKTLEWSKATGFPAFWINEPITNDKPVVQSFGVRSFEKVRNHKKGHGWKANHQS